MKTPSVFSKMYRLLRARCFVAARTGVENSRELFVESGDEIFPRLQCQASLAVADNE